MQQLLASSCMLALTAGLAAAGPFDDLAQVDILPGWQTAAGTQMAGMRITLAPGWKTYWRAPGDAGIPPSFSWEGSLNIVDAHIHWPVPEVFYQGGYRSIGYYESVVIPIELTPRTSSQPIRMSGQIDIGICEDICVPVNLSFDSLLHTSGDRDPAITAALINRPLTAAEAEVRRTTCAISPAENGLQVTATLILPSAGAEEEVVIEAGNPLIWVSEPDVQRSGQSLTAVATMIHATGEGFALDRSAIRITVLGDRYAVDIQGCPAG